VCSSDLATLRGVLSAVSSATSSGDVRHFGISLDDGELVIAGTDAGTGVFRFVLECETDVREMTSAVGVQPDVFASLVGAVYGESLELVIPLDGRRRAVTMSDGNWSAHLMPMTPAGVLARAQLETALEEAFDPDDVEFNDDGSSTVDRGGLLVRIAVRDRGEPAVLVSAVLLNDVVESLALLREVNEFNREAECCRAYVTDGRVIVESELSLLTLDGDELEAAAERLAGLVARLTPLMTMYFVD